MLQIVRDFKVPDGEDASTLDANGDGDVLVVLALAEDETLLEAFFAREIVNRVQKLRKAAGQLAWDSLLTVWDCVCRVQDGVK